MLFNIPTSTLLFAAMMIEQVSPFLALPFVIAGGVYWTIITYVTIMIVFFSSNFDITKDKLLTIEVF